MRRILCLLALLPSVVYAQPFVPRLDGTNNFSGTNKFNNETFSARIQPLTGITYDLGTSAAQWNKIWAANVDAASTLTAANARIMNSTGNTSFSGSNTFAG